MARASVPNNPVQYVDNPNNNGVIQVSGPRDPDKFDGFSTSSNGQTTAGRQRRTLQPIA